MHDYLRVMAIVGTRPEAIKMAPVIRALRDNPRIQTLVCATAQHRELLDEVFDVFQIRPDYDLDIMRPRQRLPELTARMLVRMTRVLDKERPDLVLVQGDTTTVAVASLAAFYQGIRVGHVEAGLRTGNKRCPFPEEINRRITSVIADMHFAPSRHARENLLREGVAPNSVFVTGNPVLDALRMTLEQAAQKTPSPLPAIPAEKRTILVTAHRRESFGEPMRAICAALRCIVDRHPDVRVVWPVHPNPNVSEVVHRELGECEGVLLLSPLSYVEFVQIMSRCTLILTDSGGLQEEGPSLGKPVLVMRQETERPEAIAAGTAKLVGTRTESIVVEVSRLLTDRDAYDKMAKAVNPYGDGYAARRIVAAILGLPVDEYATEAA